MISLKPSDNIILPNQPNVIDYSSSTIIQVTNWYQEAAENGDINAQYNLGRLNRNGEGIEKELEKAFYWYQKAAENGNINAQHDLAILYENGEGTEKNLEKSFHWYLKAAENGDINAQYNLGRLNKNGEG